MQCGFHDSRGPYGSAVTSIFQVLTSSSGQHEGGSGEAENVSFGNTPSHYDTAQKLVKPGSAHP
jgi:hypothetical protein